MSSGLFEGINWVGIIVSFRVALLWLLVINFAHLANGFAVRVGKTQRVLLRVFNAIKDQRAISAMGKALRHLCKWLPFSFHSPSSHPFTILPPLGPFVCFVFPFWYEFLMQLLLCRVFSLKWFDFANWIYLSRSSSVFAYPALSVRQFDNLPVWQSVNQPAIHSDCFAFVDLFV